MMKPVKPGWKRLEDYIRHWVKIQAVSFSEYLKKAECLNTLLSFYNFYF